MFSLLRTWWLVFLAFLSFMLLEIFFLQHFSHSSDGICCVSRSGALIFHSIEIKRNTSQTSVKSPVTHNTSSYNNNNNKVNNLDISIPLKCVI